MPTTITAYYIMSPGQKARSAEANANWSNHRGTNVPINTDTATASDLTHDLGTTEHRWNNVYASKYYLVGNTVASHYIDSTTAGTAIKFVVSGTQVASIDEEGITPESFWDRVVTNSPSFTGHILRQTITSGSLNLTTTVYTNSNVLVCTGQKLVQCNFIPSDGAALSRLLMNRGTSFRATILRSGTTIGSIIHSNPQITTTGQSDDSFPFSMYSFIDTSAPSGTNTYTVQLYTAGATPSASVSNIAYLIREIT